RRPLSAAGPAGVLAVRFWLVYLRARSLPADQAQPPADVAGVLAKPSGDGAGVGNPRTDCAGAVASTCKSPGPICAREVPPRPSAAVAGTAGISDRRSRRAAR